MTKTILGIGGYALSGKDALADFLEADFGYYRTFMSKPLLEALQIINPYIGTYLRFNELIESVGYTEAKKQHEVRRLLQVFATDFGRSMIDDDIWVNLVNREIAASNAERVAITGIRFKNELKYIKALGGTTVWVSRPGFGPINGHLSEASVVQSDFDVVISNDGSLTDLRIAAAWLAR